MKTIVPPLHLVLAAVVLCTVAEAQTFDVGCLRSDRISHAEFELETGSFFFEARAELSNPSNFGPAGVVNAQFNLLPATYDVDQAALSAMDIFYAAMLNNSLPLSAAEQADLLAFVMSGGVLVITADVGGNFSAGPNTMAAPFGVSWDNFSWLNENPIVTDASHPVISGPFGVVSTIGHASQGCIDNLGPNGAEIASNSNGSAIAHIPAGALGPMSGPVLFFSDVNIFSNNSTPWGPGIDQFDDRILWRNLFAYLSVGGGGGLGTSYCGPAVANSTGLPGVIGAAGSAIVADNDVTLTASGLPLNQFGYFLNSMTQASTFPVPNSQGVLCVGGAIGRYNASVFNTGAAGEGSLLLDLPNTPTPSGSVPIQAGETWNFTAWYRDLNPGATSNFTDGVSISFQ